MSVSKFSISIILLGFCMAFAYDVRVEQTDWMGGSGMLGPVTNWGTQYAERESITTATPGVVSLVATDWDYSLWTSHTLYSGSVSPFFQGAMPADIDNDGDKDIIAITGDEVSWFECIAPFSYVSHSVGAYSITDHGCIYPSDLNGDGKIDILLAAPAIGAGWCENIDGGITWDWHFLGNEIGYERISAADFDNDGDNDVLASAMYSGIVLFRNNGIDFSYELISSSYYAGFRIYPADFNNDGYPDFYSVGWNSFIAIFLNDGTGHFTISFSYDGSSDDYSYDGTWAQDMDNDGDMDIVTGTSTSIGDGRFYGFLNDGTGTNFVRITLVPSGAFPYWDGAMAADIDLDGFSDIVASYSAIGWYRQLPTSPLNFALHTIEPAIPYSHWIYVEDLDNGCAPDPDIIVTELNAHIIYENNMILSYASVGTLASSILDAEDTAMWHEFGWDACIPYENSIAFYWRAGDDISTFSSIPWNGPIPGIVLDTPDSTEIDGLGRYFQYRVEFVGSDDIAALYKVWVEYDTFTLAPPTAASIEYNEETDCDGINTVEICYTIDSPDSLPADVSIQFSSDGGTSWAVSPSTVTDAEGDLGINIVPGDHCFYWILSTDVPGIEGRDWSARIIVSALDSSDTAYYFAPLDSRPPDVNIFDYPVQIQFPDSVILNWSVEDLFWSHQPGTLSIICGSDTIDTVLSDTFFVWHPDWSTISCDNAIFRVVMRDSFCNWGEDTCVTGLCPDIVPPEIIPIDTLSKCFDF
ncbi:VCBS repeat-containing protein, partial [bacterium]|nr:VCBS repeat-containing protein [bacterium]